MKANHDALLTCSSCLMSQSRTFVPPTGRDYGLEKKWAYYNQPSIDNYASKVSNLLSSLISFFLLISAKV